MKFITLLFVLFIARAARGDCFVQTTNGPIRGISVASGKVDAFLGIPYAEPPVGPLRFAKPASKASWEDVYDANQLPPPCIQADIGVSYFAPNVSDMSEDCLYLNLWVPQSQDESELKAIIIFIHGGTFMIGSSNMGIYDGASLAEHGDVIVVTINYRLGGLGFFTDFTDNAPGNMGMFDQLEAIRWIKENAVVFQGDPSNIVLMGESAGAASISAHMISPLSKKLFRRAILLSGSILHPLFSDNNFRLSNLCQEYANELGCLTTGETLENNPNNIVDCLKTLPAEKFSEADMRAFGRFGQMHREDLAQSFYLRVGDDFLPENTIDAFRRGHFKDTELFIGITRDEGTMFLPSYMPELSSVVDEKDSISLFNETTARQLIKNFVNTGDKAEDDKIIQTYMDRVNNKGYTYLKTLSDAAGDFIINCGVVFQADIHSLRKNPVYFYVFDFRPPSTVLPKWMGVAHFEDVPYVFGNSMYSEFTQYEKEFSQYFMSVLAAFAKTGNPNIPGNMAWPKYSYRKPKYFVIGKRGRVGSKPDRNRCEIWRKIFGSTIDYNLIHTLKHAVA